MNRETRVFTLDRTEFRGIGDSAGGRQFSGHASVFNSLSEELWGFYERVAPTAFDDAIAGENDVRLLFNHNADLILARTKADTLTLSKDDAGLVSEAEFPDTSYARDLAESMDRGDVDGMSFGFRTIEDTWEEEEHEVDGVGTVTILVRTLVRVELFDVSIVVYPAYPQTDAELNAAAYRYLGMQPAWQPPAEARTPARNEARTPARKRAGKAADQTATVGIGVGVDLSVLAEQLAAGEELVEAFAERVGKVLSSTNKDLLQQANDAITAVLESAAEPEEEEDERAVTIRSLMPSSEGDPLSVDEQRTVTVDEGVVTAADLDPLGMLCTSCDHAFELGESHSLRQDADDGDLYWVVCTNCAARSAEPPPDEPAVAAAEVEPDAERSTSFAMQRRRLKVLELDLDG